MPGPGFIRIGPVGWGILMGFFRNTALLASCAVVALAAPVAAATNLGFEAGIAGWTQNGGSAGAYPEVLAANGTSAPFEPVAGEAFGFIQAGANQDIFATLSQTFHLVAGGTITGYAGFANFDGYDVATQQFFNDYGYVAVNDDHLQDWTGLAVGTGANSGWYQFSFVAPTTGYYTLEIGVANGDDANVPSAVVLDDVQLTGEVPEIATWAMMVMGLGLAGLSLRKRGSTIGFG